MVPYSELSSCRHVHLGHKPAAVGNLPELLIQREATLPAKLSLIRHDDWFDQPIRPLPLALMFAASTTPRYTATTWVSPPTPRTPRTHRAIE
jgi:hypothetical protein